MSFAKAEQLLDLATLVSSRQQGVTLEDVIERYDVHFRTAQRMMRALELRFPDVETWQDEENHKRWRLPGGQIRELLTISADELAAFDLGIKHLKRANLSVEAKQAESLRAKIVAMIPRQRIAKIETDYDAILEAQGFVARPGPKPKVNEETASKIAEAIKACKQVEIQYQAHIDEKPKKRAVHPLGLLSGPRRYLIALDPDSRRKGTIKTYRMDAISDVVVTDRFFIRPDEFDLQKFANQSFGLFQRDDEIEDVEWKFSPEAADHARGVLFHPEQKEKTLPDGSFVVTFKAAGHLEMAWYLYQWGDKVKVTKPKRLVDLISKYRRGDFPAMP